MINDVNINYISRVLNFITYIESKVIKYTLGLFNLWKEHAYNGNGINNSNVVVVLIAKNDPNGVLSLPDITTTISLHSQKNIKIIYKKVSTIEKMNQAISEIKGRNNCIKGLWLKTHGSPFSVLLGHPNSNKNYYIANQNAHLLKLNQLDPHAVIMLEGCSTGHISMNGEPCIAQKIAEHAFGRRVIASTQDVDGLSLRFNWENQSLNPQFGAPYCKSGIFGIFANILYIAAYIASIGRYSENTTATFSKYNIRSI